MGKKVFILNGPNLNLLGNREPETYGRDTLQDIAVACREKAEELGLEIDFRQTNHEGELVDWVQEAARTKAAGIIINAAAYTHTSIAVHDALRAFDGCVVEVHLSNIYRRESFRHHSFVSPAADGLICGFGAQGYLLALEATRRLIDNQGA